MFAHLYQNGSTQKSKNSFFIINYCNISFGYYSKDFRLDASSETLLIEGDPDLSILKRSYRKIWFKRLFNSYLYSK